MNVLKQASQLIKVAGALGSAAAFSTMAFGQTGTWFIPLTESAPVTPPNSYEELAMPWVTPEGIPQINLMSMREVEDSILSPGQSIVRVDAGNVSSMFDMIAYDDSGEFLFIPHETPWGAGVSRFDMLNRENHVIFQGDGGGVEGDWSNDYAAFDPCRYTPNGTLFLGEEWSGEGRIIEVLNPFDAPEDISYRELNSIANVAHEGINFSEKYRIGDLLHRRVAFGFDLQICHETTRRLHAWTDFRSSRGRFPFLWRQARGQL